MGLMVKSVCSYRSLPWISLLVMSVALLALNCAQTQDRKVRLQMKFQQGRELVYEQVNNQTITVRNSLLSFTPCTENAGQTAIKLKKRI